MTQETRRTAGRADSGPDFIEALARGLNVLRVLGHAPGPLSLSDVAAAADLARPTARRVLLTLDALDYVRSVDGAYVVTPRVLELGTSYVLEQGLWDAALPHLERLVERTGESSSIAQLDGSDIVYVARVAVPKIIALRVVIGTRFPALATSLGKVMLADLPAERLDEVLAEQSRSGIAVRYAPDRSERDAMLADVRAAGWALSDEHLAVGVRSVAAPLRDSDGRVVAAVNVTVHAAETPVERLLDAHLPHLLRAAGDISADLARRSRVPYREVGAAGSA